MPGVGIAPLLPAGLPGAEALGMGVALPAPPGLGFSNGFSGSAPPMIGTQALGLGTCPVDGHMIWAYDKAFVGS